MSFEFKCNNCGIILEVEDELIGSKAECPACHSKFIIEKEKFFEDSSIPVPPQGFNMPQTSSKFKINNLTDNANLKVLETGGCFTVYEHQMDMSVNAFNAINAYFMQKMNVRKRQVLAKLDGNTIKMQAGALQWLCGNITSETGLGSGAQAVGGFLKNAFKGMVTGESTVKPIYQGHGVLMLEPTFQHIIIEDISTWGPQGIVLQDGLFLACDATLQEKVVRRQTLSSVAAGEGLFNLCLSGNGIAVFESPVPREELIEIELENDILKIDGNMAIAWSNSLQLTVERSSKTLIGSMVNKEGLLNVYRGTGKVWMTPVVQGTLMEGGGAGNEENASAGSKVGKSILGATLDILTD